MARSCLAACLHTFPRKQRRGVTGSLSQEVPQSRAVFPPVVQKVLLLNYGEGDGKSGRRVIQRGPFPVSCNVRGGGLPEQATSLAGKNVM